MPVFVLSHHDPIVLLLPLLYHKTPINALLLPCFVVIIVLVVAGLYSLSMIKKLFTKFSVKDKVLKRELIRAHAMIVLLSIALIVQLLVNGAAYHAEDTLIGLITGIASVLLAFVAIISISVVIAIRKGKK